MIMTEDRLVLAGEFPAADYQQWRGLVDKVLKGAPFDKKLVTRTYEGIALQPLYTQADWAAAGDPSGLPGQQPFTRGGRAIGSAAHGWDIRQVVDHPELDQANRLLTEELQRGTTSLLIHFGATARHGLDHAAPAAAGLAPAPGVSAETLDQLDRLLTGIQLELVPLALSAGAGFLGAAALLAALWQRRGIADAAARGAFNADPLGALAETGTLAVPVDRALSQLADLALLTARTWPQVSAVAVDTQPYHAAGASETQDLALALSTGVAYLRALTAAGLTIDEAARQIAFTVPVGADQFIAIAKLRTLRRLWARVTEASGAAEPAQAIRHLHAITATRVLSQRDPWVNLLRTTVTTFAAGIGGADSVTTLPFDAALGVSDGFARRIARNTQVILQEESSLIRVVDPAGGSWFVERLTDQLAEAAWSQFQALERAGGIVQGLQDGSVAASLATAWDERRKNLAKRRDPVTGVSEFPHLGETPVARPWPSVPANSDQPAKVALDPALAAALIAPPGAGTQAQAAIAAATAGATLGDLTILSADGLERLSVAPLPAHRLAEDFEALRDASDAVLAASGQRPAIFLANLGTIAEHTARATFAKNFFEAGGIATLGNDGFADPAAAAAAFQASGARIAILCGSDAVYATLAVPVAQALKAAGAQFLFLAGAPGEQQAAYQAAGIDDFIFIGCDVLASLRQTLIRLGAPL